jgi:RAT1-interacting protein
LYDFDVVQRQIDRRTKYHDVKLERYLTADAADSLPDLDAPVNNKEAFLSIVRSRLGTRHTIVFGSKIDGCEKDSHHKYVELKIKETIKDDRQQQNLYRYAMLKWWAQCTVNNTEKIVCGFKDRNGELRELVNYRTSDLPVYCAEQLGSNCWEPDVCWQFLDQFLKYIKNTVKMDYNQSIYIFSFLPKTDPDYVTCEVKSSPGSPSHFLPAWFTNDTLNSRPNTETA